MKTNGLRFSYMQKNAKECARARLQGAYKSADSGKMEKNPGSYCSKRELRQSARRKTGGGAAALESRGIT
jgi:hypothetical protein